MQAVNVITVTNHLRKVEMVCEQGGDLKKSHSNERVNFLLDETLQLGGTKNVPTPMEHVLGSLTACMIIVIESIAKEIGFSFNHLKAESTATIHRRNMLGIEGVSPQFHKLNNKIWFDTKESLYRIQVLREHVKKRCPAYNLLYDAGVIIQLDWILAEEVHEKGR